MLSAVKYPEKVNGREMILVATPATSNSRSDGHIYGFYVKKDGSMELVADYDITANSAEYYAYSCLTVLTQGEEAGSLALFWEDSWASSPAAATIRYSVIAMEDVLAGVKEVVHRDVRLTVGETAVFQDDEGYYVGEDTSELDGGVASAAITGTVTETALAAGEAVSAIADGTYILVNTRAGKPLFNSAASADGGNGLSLSGTGDNVAPGGIWTIKAVSGGYTVQDADGNYLTIGSNTAGLTAAESIVSIAPNGTSWTISQSGAYLNDFGGKSICAAGWQHSSAPTDAGSQWRICTVQERPVAGISEITFTGVGIGQTQVLIGNVLYSITVTEDVPVNPFTDVPEDSFFLEPVLWAAEKDITKGVDATHFGPEQACSRAQVVAFLWRAAGFPEPVSAANPFSDVKESDFFYKAVLWAVEQGITSGVSADRFDPNAPCTRAQVVTFLWRAMGSRACDSEPAFADIQPGQYYSTAVAWALETGITSGLGGNLFGPETVCNRAQVVTFLYRAYNEAGNDALPK